MIKLTPLRIAVIGLTALVLAGVFFNSRTTGEMLLNRSGATTVINDATLATTTFNTPVKTTNSDLARSLIGHWTFDGKNLTQNIADSSSYGNEAYIYGGTTTIAGKFGQALSFDKNLLQYAEVSTTTEITANQDFTFSAWVRTTMAQTGSTWPIILSKDSQSTRKGYDLAIYNSTVSPLWYLDAYTSPSTGYIVYGASNIRDGDWHHLVAGREGSVLFAYEDGLFVATSSASAADMTDAASDLTFGRSPENTDSRFYYTGDIDDVRFWNRALSAGDVCRLYELGGKPTVDSSVRRDSHWTFDLVDIPVNITDTAGNGHTGYLFLGGNNPATTTVTGVFGEALRFNGTTNYVNVPSYTMPTENGSLSFWFYLNESTSDAPLFTSRLVSPLRIFDFFFSSGTLYAGWYNNGNDDRVQWSASEILQGKWYHGAVTWVNGGETKLYINGVFKGSTSNLDATWDTSTGNKYIAANAYNLAGYAQADIDDMRIYSRTLTGYEIRRIYETGSDIGCH